MAPAGRRLMLANVVFICSCICGVMVAAAAAAPATSSPGGVVHCKLKTQRITLFAHEILNENSFQLLVGLPQATLPDALLNFGSVIVYNYPLFPTYNFSDSATAVGTMRGTHTIVSYSGRDIFFQMNIALRDPLPVGTLTVSGVFSYEDPSLPVAVVGGTGAYHLLAQGTATVTPIEAGLRDDQTYQIDLDLDLRDEDGVSSVDVA